MADADSIAIPPRVKDLTGHPPFGRLTVLAFAGRRGRVSYWLCRCECGNEKEVCGANLVNGHSQSCGCFNRELVIASRTTHGMSNTTEYRSWTQMIQRCYNPSNRMWHRYGGRGITVCDRWRASFKAFFEDMGTKPSPKHTIERKKNDCNYEPGNCKWATCKEQNRNKRNTIWLTFLGKTQCLADWAEELGIGLERLRKRLNAGWSVERALTTPVNP